jgi:hypothetical protein
LPWFQDSEARGDLRKVIAPVCPEALAMQSPAESKPGS